MCPELVEGRRWICAVNPLNTETAIWWTISTLKSRALDPEPPETALGPDDPPVYNKVYKQQITPYTSRSCYAAAEVWPIEKKVMQNSHQAESQRMSGLIPVISKN